MTEAWQTARWRGRQWAGALCVLLVITLVPLGWVQWQQFRLLEATSAAPLEAFARHSALTESALERLNQGLQAASLAEPAITDAALRERYQELATQARPLLEQPPAPAAPGNASQALDTLRLFLQTAEPVFADPTPLVGRHDAIDPLVAIADVLQPALNDVTRLAPQPTEDTATAQHRAQAEHLLLIGALLTAALAIGLATMVLLLVRHSRRQFWQFQKLNKLSDQLARERDQADAGSQAKSLFLANMSHELRTPFHGLLGMINLLNEAGLSGRHRDYLQTAHDSALHLLGVFNDILDVSTMDAGTLRLSPTPVHLRDLVQEVEELMQVAAQDKSLALNVYTASNLPEWVQADVTRVRQILFNLLSNAIRFTREGNVIAEITRHPQLADGVLITVHDTGEGMDAQTIEQLFSRTGEGGSAPRRRPGDSGLGLEISRNLARMMGGDIVVRSEPGDGSVFQAHLILPATRAPDKVRLVHQSGTTGYGGLSTYTSQRKLRVLVAEDHPINLKYMNILLEKMGHSSVFCENGQQALELLALETFDVVVLDYHMPVLDGIATTRAIRAMEGPAALTKVILVTADVVHDTRKLAIEAGVDEFTSKPLQAEDLQRALRYCGLLDEDEDTGLPTADGLISTRHASPFPISAYELPIRLPDEQASSTLVDAEAFTEIASLMPHSTLAELLGTLFQPPEGSVPVLLSALENQDLAAVGYNAHKLKGTAMLMGLRAIVRTAAQIEEMVRKGEDPFTSGLASQLMRDMDLTQKALRQFGF